MTTDQFTDALANYLIASVALTLLLRCSIETNGGLYLTLYLLGQFCIYGLTLAQPRSWSVQWAAIAPIKRGLPC
jgi:hypothetical protein